MYLILFGGFFILYLPMLAYAASGIIIFSRVKRWGPKKSAAILAIFLGTPWLFWGGALVSASLRERTVSNFLADIQTTQVGGTVPDTILIESNNTTLKGLRVGGCIKHVLASMQILGAFGHYSGPSIAEVDPTTGKLLGAAELPASYLRFSTDNWVVPQVPNLPAYRHGPWELQAVDANGSKTIAYYYEEVVPRPAFPPILSIAGWLPRTRPPGDFKAWTDVDFVDQALAPCNRPLADARRFTTEVSMVK